MYAPVGVPAVEIIFFRGLQSEVDYTDAFWRAWLSRDGSVVWPKDWLGQKFPNARVLAISYDSCANLATEHQDTYSFGETLVDDVILDPASNVGQDCPLLLVGHSVGGIAMKQFILSAQRRRELMARNKLGFNDELRRLDQFTTNLRSLFYYGTPNGGSLKPLEDFVAKCPGNSPIWNVLRKFTTSAASLNEEFRGYCAVHETGALSVAESTETQAWVSYAPSSSS